MSPLEDYVTYWLFNWTSSVLLFLGLSEGRGSVGLSVIFDCFRPISPIILDPNYIHLKNQVIKAERRVLKELGFCVHVKHPHKVTIGVFLSGSKQG